MSEMNDNLESKEILPVYEVEQRIETALRQAVEAATGNPDLDPLQVFPEPGEVRDDLKFNSDKSREEAFRAAMADLGVGCESDLGATELGISDGYNAIIDGGQAGKILAEIQMTIDDDTKPGTIIIAATPDRLIKPVEEDEKVKERLVTAKVLDIDVSEVLDNEYEVAKQVAQYIDGFTAEKEQILPFGYDKETHDTSSEPTGQFTRIGNIQGIPIVIMSIDRHYYDAGDGKQRYDFGTTETLSIIDKIMRDHGDDETEVGFVTSATYQPSREIDAAKVSLKTGRRIYVPTYGTAALARAKREDTPTPPGLNQLAGEAHRAAAQLKVLKEVPEELKKAELQEALDEYNANNESIGQVIASAQFEDAANDQARADEVYRQRVAEIEDKYSR